MSSPIETSDLLGRDPLDLQLGRGPAGGRRSFWVRSGLASGLSATPVPGLLLVVGLAAGPEGLNLLSRNVLSSLDPAVTAALAAFGLLVGLGLDLGRPRGLRLLFAANLEAGLTLLVVAAGSLALVAGGGFGGAGGTALATALALGVCAAGSASVAHDAVSVQVRRIPDLGRALPILVGGLGVAVQHAGSPIAGSVLAAQSVVAVLAIAAAGWLLLSRSGSESEQHVFVAGVVLLLGGLGEALSLSALFHGFVAGLALTAIGGTAWERIGRDLHHLQHPVVVLLLLVAGASVSFTPAVLPLCTVYVLLRTAAKLGGGLLAARTIGRAPARGLAAALLPPGVLAAAFALDWRQSGSGEAGVVLATVVLGSVLSELVALGLRREGGA